MLVLLKNYMNYLQDNIFKCFFKKDNKILFHLKKYLSSQHIMMEKPSPRPEEENIFKDIKNLF